MGCSNCGACNKQHSQNRNPRATHQAPLNAEELRTWNLFSQKCRRQSPTTEIVDFQLTVTGTEDGSYLSAVQLFDPVLKFVHLTLDTEIVCKAGYVVVGTVVLFDLD